jgi:hypothetical protein
MNHQSAISHSILFSGVGRGALGARAPPSSQKCLFWWQSALLTTLAISVEIEKNFIFGKKLYVRTKFSYFLKKL